MVAGLWSAPPEAPVPQRGGLIPLGMSPGAHPQGRGVCFCCAMGMGRECGAGRKGLGWEPPQISSPSCGFVLYEHPFLRPS